MDDLTGLNSLHPASQPVMASSRKSPSPRRPISQALDVTGDQLEIELKPERQIGLDTKRTEPSRFSESPTRRWLKKIRSQINQQRSIEILKVTHLCQRDKDNFIDGWITQYKRGDEVLGSNLRVQGWLMGRDLQPFAIQFLVHQIVIAETPIDIPRPDVIKVYFCEHLNCGFNFQIDTDGWTGKTEILLNAVFPGGHTAMVGSILVYKY